MRSPGDPPESAKYDIPEEQIRELAIERAAARLRDIAEVIRRGIPGADVGVGEAFVIAAGTLLDQELSLVRREHALGGPPVHPLAWLLGARTSPAAAVYAETPLPTSPHLFEPSSVKIDEGDPPRCASCGQASDALIHHPDLILAGVAGVADPSPAP